MFNQAQDTQGTRVFTVIRRTGVGRIAILKRFSHILFHFLVSLEILIDGPVIEPESSPSLGAAMASLPISFHDIDVHVNTTGMKTAAELAPQATDFVSAVKTGTHVLLNTIRPVLPFLRYQRSSRILNFAIADHEGGHGRYSVCDRTKRVQDSAMWILADELVDAGIHATCIVLGHREESAAPLDRKDSGGGAYQALTLADIAETGYWVATQPSHLHVTHIDLLPTDLPFVPTQRDQR
ncbi:hypothetical protein ACFQUU_20965 [Herbaspirillum sp. GCM10030257]|uniref:hypothetical protein n=1 Tax=Herbaspirillum sp. GCM10030257 TaxID=3273393 RepID=UPI003615C022